MLREGEEIYLDKIHLGMNMLKYMQYLMKEKGREDDEIESRK